jgi:glyoxylase-like metal-dependent hydrolase (beta-lactamase superfamily II)
VEVIRGKDFIEEERVNFLARAGPEVKVDQQLKDNDLIDLGNGIELKTIHLPGHTPGSVGFYWENEGILFSGDSIPGLHIEGGSLPVIWDFSRYEESLNRVRKLDLQILLCGHHYRGLNLPPSPLRRGKEVRQYLEDCQAAASRISEVVRIIATYAPGKSFNEIASEVIANLPKEMGFTRPIQMQSIYCAMTIFFCLSKITL